MNADNSDNNKATSAFIGVHRSTERSTELTPKALAEGSRRSLRFQFCSLGRRHIALDLERQNLFRRRYAATHPGWRESGQVYEATTHPYAHANARVLDVGCGRGGVVELLHGQVALAVGVDPDQLSLVEHRAPAVRRAAGLMEQLPFPDESFDLLVCSWVLEHLARPERALAEAARVLQSPDPVSGKPGGHLVFLTPNAWHPLAWGNRVLGRMGDWQGWLVRRLYGRVEADTFPVVYQANTRRRITRLARAAGLEPVAFYAVGDPTYLAFNELFYRLAVLAERLTPRWMKVHLVGDLVKI